MTNKKEDEHFRHVEVKHVEEKKEEEKKEAKEPVAEPRDRALEAAKKALDEKKIALDKVVAESGKEHQEYIKAQAAIADYENSQH